MQDIYSKYLKEENMIMKQERESCFIDRMKERNRKSIDAIKNGYTEDTFLTKDEANLIFNYLSDMSNNISNLKMEVMGSKFNSKSVKFNKNKFERELLGLINRSENLFKLIE